MVRPSFCEIGNSHMISIDHKFLKSLIRSVAHEFAYETDEY